jgi:AraC-like DNA-binding protein
MNRDTKPPHVSRLPPSPWPELVAVELESAHRFPRHFHQVYGVGVIDEGAHRSASCRGEVDAFRGDLITTNPGDVHDGRPLGCESRRWRIVYVEPSLLVSESPEERVPGDLPEPVQGPGPFARAVRVLLNRLKCSNADTLDVLACEEALQALLACWPREDAGLGCSIEPARLGAASRVQLAIERVREQLAADAAAPPSLATLAASAGMSRFQVLRSFQAQLGMPPHAWRLALNAERARGHIDRGCSLADAAALAGFADQSHLTRVFVRQFGFTPGAYRRARQRRAKLSAQ